MKVLVTGAAGFIGCHLVMRLLELGHDATGVDNLNDYYDVQLKMDRLALIEKSPEAARFDFARIDLADRESLAKLFAKNDFDCVVNLAAQAGVRYSIKNPAAYIASNLTGFGNLLECCREAKTGHLVFASSSSVYGLNSARPYSVRQNVDHPASLYAATKKSNELMAHAYSHLFGLSCTGLRFFTVYGPWGRPDMAPYLFASAILKNRPIQLFNNGELRRDFTYIDDIIAGIVGILDKPASPSPLFDPEFPNPALSSAPWRVYNIGKGESVPLGEFVDTLESVLGKKAIREYLPMQPGDVKSTWAEVEDFHEASGIRPGVPLKDGLAAYARWHLDYYGKN